MKIQHILPNTIRTSIDLNQDDANPVSAKITIQGGRYNYTFDNHRRLIKAAYTPKTSGSAEDFSVEYTYDAVANPQYIKRKGVINISSTDKV